MSERINLAELRDEATERIEAAHGVKHYLEDNPARVQGDVLLALVEAVEAARAVRRRHPGNAESADLVLDRCLSRFSFEDTNG